MDNSGNGYTRRDFLRTAAVFSSAVVLGAPLTPYVSPAHASLSSVPVVDRLTVTALVDAYFDLLARDEATCGAASQARSWPHPRSARPVALPGVGAR